MLHYTPDDGFVGDVVPVDSDGELCHLLYLKAPRPPARSGASHTTYAHIVSRDLIHWEPLGEVIAPGGADDVDGEGCWTGSVIQHDGTYHLFYTGYHSRRLAGRQTICHATSRDLRSWTKDPSNPLFGADATLGYELHDWRDPFVFRHPTEGKFWMLITARLSDGPAYWRGCTGLAVSDDLTHWDVQPPIWVRGAYHTQECQDLFRLGDRWYLIYSEYSRDRVTRYRVADSLDGPWSVPPVDQLDGARYYAAKTVRWNSRRLLFGWIPTRRGETDGGDWEWGGALGLPRELVALPDGRLACRCPAEVLAGFTEGEVDLGRTVEAMSGRWSTADGLLHVVTESFALARLSASEETPCLLEVLVRPEGAREAGVGFRISPDGGTGYRVGIDAWGRRLVIRRWPRDGFEGGVLAEHPLEWNVGDSVSLRIVFDGEIVEVFANDTVSLACRVYDYREGSLGLFAEGGSAQFIRCALRLPVQRAQR